jgi:hypothetical protein
VESRAKCEYATDARKRRHQAPDSSIAGSTRSPDGDDASTDAAWRKELTTQLTSIAADLAALKSAGLLALPASGHGGSANRAPHLPLTPDSSNTTLRSGRAVEALPGSSQGNPWQPFDVLLDNNGVQQAISPSRCWLLCGAEHGNCYIRELSLWDAEVTHSGLQPLQDTMQTYFALMYPHCAYVLLFVHQDPPLRIDQS